MSLTKDARKGKEIMEEENVKMNVQRDKGEEAEKETRRLVRRGSVQIRP
jgi:hypothetical protein